MSQLTQQIHATNMRGENALWFQESEARREENVRDLETIAAVQAGTMTAFDELHRRYSRRLYTTIMRVTRNREDAEDALQDTFLRAFQALHQFECRSSVYSWLTRIAINSALMILRKRRSRREGDLMAPLEGCEGFAQIEIEDTTPNPEQLCEVRQRCHRLIRAIERLQPHLRTPIERQLTKEHSMKEIAMELNVTVATVKARLHRARVRLVKQTVARGER